MFDNPRDDLHWLQEELLAEEQAEGYDEDYGDEEEDDPQYCPEDDPELAWLQQVHSLLGPEDPQPQHPTRAARQTKASKAARQAPPAHFQSYDPGQEWDESAAVFDDEPPPKGIGGLLVLAILELLGILAVVGWWLKWLEVW